MQVNAVSEQIKSFIVQHFPLARSRQLRHDDPLLENGILDSLGVLELVTYLEEEFNISLSDEELVPENFQTIACLTAFVQKKGKAN
jgi:acyl carrier protein